MVEAMQTQLVLLRTAGADVQLAPGTLLAARVLGPGAISLAGVRLAATLPPGLEPGVALRLQVTEASTAQLVLRIVGTAQPGQAVEQPAGAAQQAGPAAPPPVAVPLPGEASARLIVDPDGGGAPGGPRRPGAHSVTLRYESPGLGRLDLALTVDRGMVSAVAHAPAGEVADRLRAGSGELRAALAEALARPARVAVVAREETLDVRA